MTYTSLYRFYDDKDVLLYVGITNSLSHRLAQHEATKSWWLAVRAVTVEHHDTREQAETAERDAIRAELPVWNIAHQPKVSLIDRMIVMRPLLVDVLEVIHHETQLARTDRSWCIDEAWFERGLRQRALFAMENELPPPPRPTEWDDDDVWWIEEPVTPPDVCTFDEFIDRHPAVESHEHDEWVDDQWGALTDALVALLPRCGPDCEHRVQRVYEDIF